MRGKKNFFDKMDEMMSWTVINRAEYVEEQETVEEQAYRSRQFRRRVRNACIGAGIAACVLGALYVKGVFDSYEPESYEYELYSAMETRAGGRIQKYLPGTPNMNALMRCGVLSDDEGALEGEKAVSIEELADSGDGTASEGAPSDGREGTVPAGAPVDESDGTEPEGTQSDGRERTEPEESGAGNPEDVPDIQFNDEQDTVTVDGFTFPTRKLGITREGEPLYYYDKEEVPAGFPEADQEKLKNTVYYALNAFCKEYDLALADYKITATSKVRMLGNEERYALIVRYVGACMDYRESDHGETWEMDKMVSHVWGFKKGLPRIASNMCYVKSDIICVL